MRSIFVFVLICFSVSTRLISQTYQWDWVEKIEGIGTQQVTALNCDGNRVFHAGTFQDTVVIGSDPYIAEGYSDAFLCVYNNSRQLIHKTIFHGSGIEKICNVLPDSNGDFWLIGETSDTLFFDTTFIPCHTANSIFILHFDSSFNVVSFKISEGLAGSQASSPAASWNQTHSRIIIAGRISGDASFFDNDTIQPISLFLTGFNTASNQFTWTKRINADAFVNDLSLDDSGDVYIVGSYYNIDEPDAGVYFNHSGFRDGFVLKSDTTGDVKWASTCGGMYFEEMTGIEFSDSNDVFVVGYFASNSELTSSFDMVSTSLTPYQLNIMGDVLLLKYSPQGEIKTIKTAGGNGNDKGYDIAQDQNGNVYIAGTVVWAYQDSIWFDNVGFQPFGGQIPFVAKYDQNLNIQHIFYSQLADHTEARKLFIQNDTSIYTSGTFCGLSTFSDIIIESSDSCPGSWDVSDVYISHISKADMFGRIQGTLYLSGSPLEYMVSLFKKTGPNEASFIMKKWADYQGHYYFDVYSQGEYFVRGETYDHCPTYYVKEYLWTEAEVFNINSDTLIDNIDIHLFVNQNLGGNNVISGTVYSQDSIPLQWIRLILTDTIGDFIAMEYSDSLGFYEFQNIPEGTYHLLADTSGINIFSYYTITISGAKAAYEHYDFIMCMNSMICTAGEVGIVKQEIPNYEVFPNPASNYFYVNAENIIAESVSLYSTDGKKISVKVTANDQQCMIVVNEEISGLYLLKFRTESGEAVSRVIVIGQ